MTKAEIVERWFLAGPDTPTNRAKLRGLCQRMRVDYDEVAAAIKVEDAKRQESHS